MNQEQINMTYKDKVMQEFDDDYSAIFYTRPSNGLEASANKQAIKSFISKILDEQREEIVREIGEYSKKPLTTEEVDMLMDIENIIKNI